MKIKKDKFRRNRGGWSRVWEIRCAKCESLLCVYQEDGPGTLKRMYEDRILEWKDGYFEGIGYRNHLLCVKCYSEIAFSFIYTNHGENRIAFRMYVGAVKKHLIYKG